jgi:hypothetical protein
MSRSNDEIPAIIAAAIAAAGPKGTNEAQWKAKVNDAIPYVVSMLGEGSRQWRLAAEMLEAQIFTGLYVGHTVEESSTRCVVQIDTERPSKKYPDGIEPIRSHRTDNPQGKAMQARLERLEPGQRIVVWKSMETTAADDTMKVRVLAHFEVLPQRRGDSTPAPRDSAPSVETVAPGRGGSTPPGGNIDERLIVLTDRFEALSGPAKVRAVRRLRDEGLEFPTPTLEQAERFAAILSEV